VQVDEGTQDKTVKSQNQMKELGNGVYYMVISYVSSADNVPRD
jgi:hypothetical protein